MKILVDIGHPAHVHFYRKPIQIWLENGHQVLITSRHKEIATDLLDALKIEHHVLSSINDGTIRGMAVELISRDIKLFHLVRKERPDIMTGIGGTYVAHVGLLTRIPSIIFYDTENATLANLITYPFCRLVVVPNCYKSWLPPWSIKYPGYHELSYLRPNNFTPDKGIAEQCGLSLNKPTFLIRTVSWQASHDLDEKGWTIQLLTQLVNFLEIHGKVIISSEGDLPDELKKHKYSGLPENIHHLMAYLSLYVGESATMASECAVLGVPSIYAANTGRGYTDEQEEKYKLVYNIQALEWPSFETALNEIFVTSTYEWVERRNRLLNDTIDVGGFIADLIMNYPESVSSKKNFF